MAREWQFLEEIEDAGADGAGLRGRLQKYCLEVPQFLGDTQHLPGAQSARVREDGEAVARIGGWAEYINMKVFERHLPSSRACNCSVKSQFLRVFAGERREARYGRLPDDVGKAVGRLVGVYDQDASWLGGGELEIARAHPLVKRQALGVYPIPRASRLRRPRLARLPGLRRDVQQQRQVWAQPASRHVFEGSDRRHI
jgi:hypothetical protein